jgi:hypothetical protein
MDNKAITHSEFLMSTPQKIMLKEIRMKRLLALGIKARNGKKPVEAERKGDTETKEQKYNFSLSKKKKEENLP